MDSKLEVHRRGNFSVARVLHDVAHRSCFAPGPVPHDTLDPTLGTLLAFFGSNTPSTTSTASETPNVPPCHAFLYIDHHPHHHSHRDALCAKSALSVLLLRCLDNTVLVVENRNASYINLLRLGRTRMGMERISKHQHKFLGRGYMSGSASSRSLVGI